MVPLGSSDLTLKVKAGKSVVTNGNQVFTVVLCWECGEGIKATGRLGHLCAVRKR